MEISPISVELAEPRTVGFVEVSQTMLLHYDQHAKLVVNQIMDMPNK